MGKSIIRERGYSSALSLTDKLRSLADQTKQTNRLIHVYTHTQTCIKYKTLEQFENITQFSSALLKLNRSLSCIKPKSIPSQ